MGRTRISLPAVSTSALAVVDRDGLDGLSLSNVADDLGVGPSALYNYVDGLDGLRYLVAVAATNNLTGSVRDAAIGTAGGEALLDMGEAYRGFALENPGQFASTLVPPRTEDDDLARANRALLDVFVLVYRAIGLPDDEAHLAARSTRSAIHGFLALEHTTGTTIDHQAEFTHLLAALQRGILDQRS